VDRDGEGVRGVGREVRGRLRGREGNRRVEMIMASLRIRALATTVNPSSECIG